MKTHAKNALGALLFALVISVDLTGCSANLGYRVEADTETNARLQCFELYAKRWAMTSQQDMFIRPTFENTTAKKLDYMWLCGQIKK